MSRFAKTDDEAEKRYEKFKSLDPYPEIPPALLNSADIEDYVANTGMLFPFAPSPSKKLKLAAYEADFLGEVIYFGSEKRDLHHVTIERDMEFILPPNSITFVSIEPMLRLPEYIALRFNLKIRHVHKGLLLGTGPLVDPGFRGRLFIPLHNLTTNSYSFKGGEGLIWFEFTKISEHEKWSWRDKERPLGRLGQLGRTPTPTENTTPIEYIRRAVGPERAIVSSIPDALQEAKHSADEAEKQVRRLGQLFTIGGAVAVIALLLTIGFGVIPIYSLVEQSDSLVSETTGSNMAEIKKAQHELEGRVKALESRVPADENKPSPATTSPPPAPIPTKKPPSHAIR